MVGGGGQKCEILAISNQYKNMLDDFGDSSDLEYLEMLRLNSQRQCNLMLNLKNKYVDIKTNSKDFSNISQQRKKALKVENDTVFQPSQNNFFIGQKRYKKR